MKETKKDEKTQKLERVECGKERRASNRLCTNTPGMVVNHAQPQKEKRQL